MALLPTGNHPLHPSVVPNLERRVQEDRRQGVSAALKGYLNAAFPVESRDPEQIAKDNAFVSEWQARFDQARSTDNA